MPSIGGWEWLIILVIVIIIFGVGKLGDVGGALGKSMKEFRNAASSGEDETTGEGEAKSEGDSGEAEGTVKESNA